MSAPSDQTMSFSGKALPTNLTANMGAGDMSFTIVDATTWTETYGTNYGQKLGTSGPFVVTVDYGLSTAEKILCSALSGNTTNAVVTVSQRGWDGSTAQSHTSQLASTTGYVVHTFSAQTAYEANQAAAQTYSPVSPTASAPGDASSNGTGPQYSYANHKHARESYVTIGNALMPNAFAAGSGTTTSATNVNALTGLTGPSVTVVTGTTAIVLLTAQVSCSVANKTIYLAAGTNTTNGTSLVYRSNPPLTASNSIPVTGWGVLTGLTAGTNTIYTQFSTSGGTATISNPQIIVIPQA